VTLVLATENRHKCEEIAMILRGGLAVTRETLADYPEIHLPPETGSDYAENALQKAVTVAQKTGHLALGDDSGLEVDALGGAPGLYSARFAGESATYAENRTKLLNLLTPFSDEKRGAKFICVIAIAHPSGEARIVKGICNGRIADAACGEGGFGYDPIFFIPAYQKTFSQLTPSEKNKISHRGQAVRAAMEMIRTWMV